MGNTPTGLDLDANSPIRGFVTYLYWCDNRDEQAANEVIEQYVQALTRWGLEQRIDELKKLPQSYDYIDSGGEYIDSSSTKAIKERIAELQANLQDGGKHGDSK